MQKKGESGGDDELLEESRMNVGCLELEVGRDAVELQGNAELRNCCRGELTYYGTKSLVAYR